MRVARASGGDHIRVVGASVGVLILGAVLAALIVVRPFDIDPGPLLERPEGLVFVLLLTGIVGWWAGPSAASSGFAHAGAVGVGAGIAWVLLAVPVAVVAAFVDSFARGSASAVDLGPTLVWGVYALVLVTLIWSAMAAPIGLVWGIATRSVVHRPRGLEAVAPRDPGRRAVAALTLLALLSGLFQAAATSQPDARCFDVGGERPLDGAFSPDGEWLAIVASNDLNRPGLVRLMRWPSGETVATWRAWVDHDVAVDPDGRVYWSAFELEEPWRGGILTAVAGSEPEWLTTDEESSLWSLTWTDGALRGMTGNSHRVASLSLDGLSEPTLVFGPGSEPVGSFWASPDGRTTATSPEWFGTHVAVTHADGSVVQVPVPGDARSMAVTPDGTSLVAASWSDGTRVIDIGTGASRLLLRGSQSWIAVSRQGDLAWTDEEQVGPGRVCIAPLLGDHRATTGGATQ
jgi:hypothetical protein